MALSVTKLPSGRYGIFNRKKLLFTVGSQETIDTIVRQLSSKQIPVRVLVEG